MAAAYFQAPPTGKLKVVAVVSVRLVNTPATLRNQGGWFVCFENSTMQSPDQLDIFEEETARSLLDRLLEDSRLYKKH